MKILIANDHAGLELKNYIKTKFPELEFDDLGTMTTDSVDYPDYAAKLSEKMPAVTPESEVKTFGILICGSGQGVAIKANKFPHIRAALCWDETSTRLSREHNNANVLCMGGRLIPNSLAKDMVEIFLKTKFLDGRHSARVKKL